MPPQFSKNNIPIKPIKNQINLTTLKDPSIIENSLDINRIMKMENNEENYDSLRSSTVCSVIEFTEIPHNNAKLMENRCFL